MEKKRVYPDPPSTDEDEPKAKFMAKQLADSDEDDKPSKLMVVDVTDEEIDVIKPAKVNVTPPPKEETKVINHRDFDVDLYTYEDDRGFFCNIVDIMIDRNYVGLPQDIREAYYHNYRTKEFEETLYEEMNKLTI
jgi:hypothetical protein